MLASTGQSTFRCHHHARACMPSACLPVPRSGCMPTARRQWRAFTEMPCTSLHMHAQAFQSKHRCVKASSDATGAVTTEDDVVRLATIGDLVTIHFTCKDAEGKILESSKDTDEPLSFELGAGEIMGNKLFQGFDEAVRGLAVGQATVIEAAGGEWQRELLFVVPKDHPELTRLEGRYRSVGGLQKDMIVELANGSLAVIVDMADDVVKIDANNMMAGKKLVFELELLAIDKPPPPPQPAVLSTDSAQSSTEA